METPSSFSSFIIILLATVSAARFFVCVVMRLRIPAIRIFVVAIVGFVLFQIVNRIHVGFWDPFIMVAFSFGMPVFLLISALLEIIFSHTAAPTSLGMMAPRARRRWIIHGRLIMRDLVLERRHLGIFILALLVLIFLGYGWLPPFSIYLIILLCSIRLWSLRKRKVLLFCFLFFLVFLVSPSFFPQEGEGVASFLKDIFFLGMMFFSQVILFLMIYFSLDDGGKKTKQGRIRQVRENETHDF
jgi:hypothetical protein